MKKKSEIQIFLAHASEDKPAVFELYDRLKAAGYKPWLDKKDLIPGQNWRTEIPNAIKNSQFFIACLSQKSITKEGYVQIEFKLALSKYAEMPPQVIYIIPLRLNDCNIPDLRQEEYGVNLRDLHWLDYWEKDGFEQIEKTIAHQFAPFEEETPQQPRLKSFKFDVILVNTRGEPIRKESKEAQYFAENLGNGVTLDMVAVPGGKFLMGTEDSEIERLCKKYNWNYLRRERPQHQVTIQSFYMSKYLITQAQWRVIASRTDLKEELDLNPDPSHFPGDDRPVENANYWDAIEFCNRLSKLTKREYWVPTEAQWEYACRAGTTTPFYFGETITGELANYKSSETYAEEPRGRYREKNTPVGQFPPNAFGLYDMHGNVWEWCEDNLHKDYEDAPTDDRAWLSRDKPSCKVMRGGSLLDEPIHCRSASRNGHTPNERCLSIGLRVVRVLPIEPF